MLTRILFRILDPAIIVHSNFLTFHRCPAFLCFKYKNRLFCTNSLKSTDFKLRAVEFITNVDRWDEKPQGILVKTIFIDTCYDKSAVVKAQMPILLGVHGSPGNHNDLLPIAKSFSQKGYRIIIVNFPGYGYTSISDDDEDFFMHSTEEKAQFLADFLEAIDVTKKIDLAVGHSIGCLSLIFLAAMTSHIRSLVLICSPPPHKPPRSADPFVLVGIATELWETRLLRPLLRICTLIVARTKGLIMKAHHVPAILHTVANARFGPLQGFAHEVERKKLPLIFFSCKPDVFIQSNLNREHAEMYGITELNMDIVGADGFHKQKGEPILPHYVKGIQFLKATHYPQKDESLLPIIIKEMETLANHVKKMQNR